jgi:hypothetical protein
MCQVNRANQINGTIKHIVAAVVGVLKPGTTHSFLECLGLKSICHLIHINSQDTVCDSEKWLWRTKESIKEIMKPERTEIKHASQQMMVMLITVQPKPKGVYSKIKMFLKF